MAELDVITESLRRQRKDLEQSLDETLSRRSETVALIDQIGNLRVRCERARGAADAQPAKPPALLSEKK